MTDFRSGMQPGCVKTSQELQLWEPKPKRVLDCALHIVSGKGGEKIHSFLLASLQHISRRRAGGCLRVYLTVPVVSMIDGISGLKSEAS